MTTLPKSVEGRDKIPEGRFGAFRNFAGILKKNMQSENHDNLDFHISNIFLNLWQFTIWGFPKSCCTSCPNFHTFQLCEASGFGIMMVVAQSRQMATTLPLEITLTREDVMWRYFFWFCGFWDSCWCLLWFWAAFFGDDCLGFGCGGEVELMFVVFRKEPLERDLLHMCSCLCWMLSRLDEWAPQNVYPNICHSPLNACVMTYRSTEKRT